MWYAGKMALKRITSFYTTLADNHPRIDSDAEASLLVTDNVSDMTPGSCTTHSVLTPGSSTTRNSTPGSCMTRGNLTLGSCTTCGDSTSGSCRTRSDMTQGV